MSEKIQIGRKDMAWNFGGTFMRVASGLIVLPLVLRLLPDYEVGLYYIFIEVTSLVALLDFGFSNTFTRNITFVFGGSNKLLSKGYIPMTENSDVNYGLLRSVIRAMKRYYAILAGIFIVFFISVGPFYLIKVLESYPKDVNDQHIWIAWWIFGLLTAYQLYTYYYSSLLIARGYIKKNQQAIIIGQSVRIVICIICLLCGLGLISMVIGQFCGDLLSRTLARRAFYDKELKLKLSSSSNETIKTSEVIKTMAPNAIKMGLVSISGFAVNKLSIFVAPFYLSLNAVGSFGLTRQMISIIASIAMIWFGTFYPKITERRLKNENEHLKRMYIKGNLFLIASYVVCGLGLIIVGPPLLELFNSGTALLSTGFIVLYLLISFLETNHSLAAQVLLTKNEVPFFKAAIAAGGMTIILLYIFLKFTSLGVFSLILAPGISQIVYQNWKWVYDVWKELGITAKDYLLVLKNSFKSS